MAGTLITNSIAPDVGTNLYLNATQGAANVVIGNTTTALATFTNAGTLIVSNVVSNLVGNVVGNVVGNIANTNITGNIISSQITSVANTQITGTIIATQGGTGLTSPGTAGNVLTSSGTAWTSSAPISPVKAWVNFNGTLSTPITPRDSYNVTNITKNGTGDYTINFTNALSNANYATIITVGPSQGTVVDAGLVVSYTTTGVRVYTYYFSGYTEQVADYATICVAVFGS